MDKVKVVVIGGGIIGASILYHLAKRGWTDVLLLEKTVLTAGSTWHAAANGNTLNATPNISRLQKKSIDLYARLPEETGQSLGEHRPGGLMIATTEDRMNEYRLTYDIGRRLGHNYELITPEELRKRHPLTNTDGIIGALYEPLDGHIDPYGATHALAKGAKQRGASIRLNTEVRELHQEADGSWRVVTDSGEIAADIIVNAGGFWANEVAQLSGARLPMTPMEHHYLITETIPEVEKLDRELPLIRDPDASFYMRQENQGLLLGIYEADPRPWGVDGIPKNFGQELLPNDIDRLLPNLEIAFERFPALAEAGIKQTVNGPFVFTPDGRPLIGPMPGQRNHFCAAGFIAGLSMGGGFGDVIAEWIVTGRTEIDMSSCDVARFGQWANGDYRIERAKDLYAHRYHQHYPHEEREAGRPVRTFPLYERQKANGAVFGSANGWERPLWYATKGQEARDIYSFARQNWFDTVGEECRAVRTTCGIMDASVFAKYEVTGPEARSFLDRVLANSLPLRNGRLKLAHMLDETGGIIAEFSVTKMADDSYFLIGASAAEAIHLRWLVDQARKYNCTVTCVSADKGVLSIAGPQSRALLQGLTEHDLSKEAFPFLSSQNITITNIKVLAMRVSFTGELGFELYCDMADLLALYDAIKEAGDAFGLRDFGARAMDSLRMEKGYPRFGSELNTEVTPFEAGLDFAVALSKGDFTGREALAEQKSSENLRYRIVVLELEDGHNDDPVVNESVYLDGNIIGYVCSGGYGHTVGKSLAMSLLKPEFAIEGQSVEINILGKMRTATLSLNPPHDPKGELLRS